MTRKITQQIYSPKKEEEEKKKLWQQLQCHKEREQHESIPENYLICWNNFHCQINSLLIFSRNLFTYFPSCKFSLSVYMCWFNVEIHFNTLPIKQHQECSLTYIFCLLFLSLTSTSRLLHARHIFSMNSFYSCSVADKRFWEHEEFTFLFLTQSLVVHTYKFSSW